MTRVVLAGAGSFAVEVSDVCRAAGLEVAAWIEGLDESAADMDADPPVVWVGDQARFEPEAPLVVGIGSVKRRALIELLLAQGRVLETVVHPSAIVSPTAVIEPGCVIFPGVIVGALSRIGTGTIVNRGALVGHHTTIGRHCFLGPGANVAGKVTIADEATIALAAVVRDHLSVGSGATVGAGAVAVADVPAGVTVVGIPAKALSRSADG